MKLERAQWKENQPALEVTKLILIDETGASTNMTRRRGRAPIGARCVSPVPHGHWKTTTCIAGVRVGEVTAPMVLDGPMDGAACLVYVRDFLCPALKPGDIVIADNLGSPKIAAARAAIEAVGAALRFLPPYSPDLNPIDTLFAQTQGPPQKSRAPHRRRALACNRNTPQHLLSTRMRQLLLIIWICIYLN